MQTKCRMAYKHAKQATPTTLVLVATVQPASANVLVKHTALDRD